MQLLLISGVYDSAMDHLGPTVGGLVSRAQRGVRLLSGRLDLHLFVQPGSSKLVLF